MGMKTSLSKTGRLGPSLAMTPLVPKGVAPWVLLRTAPELERGPFEEVEGVCPVSCSLGEVPEGMVSWLGLGAWNLAGKMRSNVSLAGMVVPSMRLMSMLLSLDELLIALSLELEELV